VAWRRCAGDRGGGEDRPLEFHSDYAHPPRSAPSESQINRIRCLAHCCTARAHLPDTRTLYMHPRVMWCGLLRTCVGAAPPARPPSSRCVAVAAKAGRRRPRLVGGTASDVHVYWDWDNKGVKLENAVAVLDNLK
jgi:hypothetical protein